MEGWRDGGIIGQTLQCNNQSLVVWLFGCLFLFFFSFIDSLLHYEVDILSTLIVLCFAINKFMFLKKIN